MCLFLQAAFGGQYGGLLLSVAAHFSHLSLMCLAFCRQFSGDSVAAFYCKIFSGWTQLILFYQAVFTNTNCLRPFIQVAIFLFKQVLNLSPTANKGIAASRAGRCYLRLQLASSFGCGLDKHLWTFVCYLLLLYLYSAAVGVGHSNEFPACSNTQSLAASWFQANSWGTF